MLYIYYTFYIIFSLYSILILLFTKGFYNLKTTQKLKNSNTLFSVIIPFRNESKNLERLLNSIAEIRYPKNKFEIIFVDDDSKDNSVEIIRDFCKENKLTNITIINNKRASNSPKKDAIKTAIGVAKYNWIVTTDADCILPEKWLISFSSLIQKVNPNMIVAPVKISGNSYFLEQFQKVDFLSMQGATIGGFGIKIPFMANGANLAYKKELFFELSGFNDNDFIASGDDIFLLENFLNYNKNKVHFLKTTNALVTTFAVKSWQDLIQQRKRWAAKTTHFKSNITKCIGVIVFLANFATISTLPLIFTDRYIIFFLGFKFCVDAFLIFKTARFYKQRIPFLMYLKIIFFHPFFTAYIAIASISSTFVWKERSFRK